MILMKLVFVHVKPVWIVWRGKLQLYFTIFHALKVQKKVNGQFMILSSKPFSYTFLQDYLFATFSHIGVYFFCHCFYTHVKIQTSFNLSRKLICGRHFLPIDLMQNLKKLIHLSYSEAEPKFVVLKVQTDAVFKLVTTTFLLATIFHHFGI